MRISLVTALTLALATLSASAQSLDDLNIQVHGYATQAFLYTTNNNILTTDSSNGSPAWSEAVVNVSAQPNPRLRVAVQGRYFLLGNYGNGITLDWAAADYKQDDHFGVRFGKVKTPSGLFNEVQDIDPAYLWSLLPQSVYPLASRNSTLSHYGGVAYGAASLGLRLGKLEYRAWGGERSLQANDGYFVLLKEWGFDLPNGLDGITYGAALRWKTPLPGLTIGASDSKQNNWNDVITQANGALTGTILLHHFHEPNYFGSYEKARLMLAGEVSRLDPTLTVSFNGIKPLAFRTDAREWYAMASWKVSNKLNAGVYDSQFINHQVGLGPSRYSKDWALSGRYDFNQFLYAKVEQHFIEGTALSYDITLNPGGLKPNTRLSILKVGVSF